jgi:tetratricopeptide (TPR) repeat protein
MPAPTLCGTSIGTKSGPRSCSQRSKGSQMITTPSRNACSLSRLFYSLGNYAESKRLISSALKLYRERRDDLWVAQALRHLSDTNRLMGLPKEGIQQAKEALEILNGSVTQDQADCLINLARLLVQTISSTPPKKPHSAQSISSRRKANNIGSADLIVLSAIYINPRARWRRQFTITSWPSELRPLSIGTMTYFGFITNSQGCFAMKAGSTTHRLILNMPSRTRPIAHSTWVTRWRSRPGFGTAAQA